MSFSDFSSFDPSLSDVSSDSRAEVSKASSSHHLKAPISHVKRDLVLGVDPGLSGALALYRKKNISGGGEVVDVWDMPLQGGLSSAANKGARREIDPYTLSKSIEAHALHVDFAVIEAVSAMTYVDRHGEKRGQGAAASFAFGKSAGVAIGVIASFNIPIYFVKPSVWKSLMNLSSDKTLSIKKAKALFPDVASLFSRTKDDGRAEALLLAYFGAQRFT